jgi:hypothetical protein
MGVANPGISPGCPSKFLSAKMLFMPMIFPLLETNSTYKTNETN